MADLQNHASRLNSQLLVHLHDTPEIYALLHLGPQSLCMISPPLVQLVHECILLPKMKAQLHSMQTNKELIRTQTLALRYYH